MDSTRVCYLELFCFLRRRVVLVQPVLPVRNYAQGTGTFGRNGYGV
jgi:hypothetical protein